MFEGRRLRGACWGEEEAGPQEPRSKRKRWQEEEDAQNEKR